MATLMTTPNSALRPSRAFNAMFNQLLSETLPGVNRPAEGFVPAADVLETANGYELLLTLPGVPKDSLTIDVQQGTLTVSGERKAPVAEGENAPKLRRMESSYGSFSRQFRLPDNVNAKAVEAELTDGVLRLVLPYDADKTARFQIEVR
ncbi:Hsp20/alpha crystallin family protein [Hymenobacter busanensis]|uniref:Hsp20/alpha crystallin family protein n=1 Tax=Hymenobacter busanensis TaxID=2607656 RepID=A0A7L4ZZK6_9BACT|nr:Hsp20/alpha crystallin family protein [Hymenobacter busanensis]KAA9338612.1 Hsp20/alpha crystallin family protein [Hymenobacter busanensis]QHJ08959.1 Hsp20 family protein [Hymenobacter busanensis]